MANAIEITILTITQDSKNLDFVVKCPETYDFTTLQITKYNVLTHAWESTVHVATGLLPPNSHEVSMRIATSALVVPSGPDFLNNSNVTMYKVEFGASPNAAGIAAGLTETISAVGICSNVSFVYFNLLDLVMRFTNCCISDQDYDNLDRNHMILYAHTEAMRLGRLEEATFFYDIIWHLFTSCGPTTRQNDVMNKPCNCD